MNHLHITLSGFAIALLASAPAFAGGRHHRDTMGRAATGHDDRQATIRMLEHRDDALQRQALERNLGAVGRTEIAEQRDLIDDVIDDLEDGRPVAPRTIDQALGYSYHGYRHHHHDTFGS